MSRSSRLGAAQAGAIGSVLLLAAARGTALETLALLLTAVAFRAGALLVALLLAASERGALEVLACAKRIQIAVSYIH